MIFCFFFFFFLLNEILCFFFFASFLHFCFASRFQTLNPLLRTEQVATLNAYIHMYTPSYTMKSVFLVSSNYSQLLWRNLIANRMRDELLFLNSFGFFFLFFIHFISFTNVQMEYSVLVMKQKSSTLYGIVLTKRLIFSISSIEIIMQEFYYFHLKIIAIRILHHQKKKMQFISHGSVLYMTYILMASVNNN